jgi:endonuclease YncB( thermonuclease family)
MKLVKALQAVHYGEDKYHKERTQFKLEDDIADELVKEGVVQVVRDLGMTEEEVKAAEKKAKKPLK